MIECPYCRKFSAVQRYVRDEDGRMFNFHCEECFRLFRGFSATEKPVLAQPETKGGAAFMADPDVRRLLAGK